MNNYFDYEKFTSLMKNHINNIGHEYISVSAKDFSNSEAFCWFNVECNQFCINLSPETTAIIDKDSIEFWYYGWANRFGEMIGEDSITHYEIENGVLELYFEDRESLCIEISGEDMQ